MGFLHKLWDETLAGPAPEDAVVYKSFSTTNPHLEVNTTPISRSITVLRSDSANLHNLNINANPASPDSPLLPSSPSASPFSPSTLRVKKLARRKSTAEAIQCYESRSPTGYDWIVLSALDR